MTEQFRRAGLRPGRVTCWKHALTIAAASVAVVVGLITPSAALAATCGSAGVTVSPLHGTRFYVDSSASPQLSSGYTGVSISPTAARSNVWVKLSGFGGGRLGLNSNQQAAIPLGNLSAGGTTPAYFFLTASTVAQTSTAQTFDVDVYQGDPSNGGTLLCTYGEGYSSGIYDTLQAAANKVQDVTGDSIASSVSTTSPEIGGTITLTVEGTTGTLGNGPDGTPFIYETPSSLSSWPASSFRLVGTSLTLSPGASQTVYTNQLQISNSSFSSAQNYFAQYTFRITGTTPSATTPAPIQEISSGTQVKHTNVSSLTGSIPAIQPASNPLTLTQSASTSSLPASGGTVDYTATLQSTSSNSASVDEIVDTLPPGASFVSGSAKLNGTAIGDPTVTGGSLVFAGPFTVSSSGSAVLTYTLSIPGTSGTYSNSVVGYVAATTIDTTTDTTNSSPATTTVTVPGAAQTISFSAPTDTRVDHGPVSLSASASSGLAVSFTSATTGVCTVSGSTVNLITTGTCSITASQAGDGTFGAATPVSHSFQVTAAPLAQTITFPAPADTRVDQGPVGLVASASGGLAVSFASTTPGVCTISGSSATLLSTGTCTITATQAGDSSYSAATPVSQSFQVTAVPVVLTPQTITFAQPADTQADQGPVSLSATTTSGLAVSFSSGTTGVCTISRSSVTPVATGTCTITATQPGDATYAAATPVSQSFQVTAAPVVPSAQSISFIEPADTRVDQGPVVLTATAVSGLPVSFASTTSAVCTVSGASVTLVSTGTCTLTATQAGDATYAAATPVSQSFQITAAPVVPSAQSISFIEPADTRVDQGPVVLTATAVSGLPVSFASTTSAVCTVSGASVTLVSTGTCTLTATQAGDASWAAATPVSQSFQITAAPVVPSAQSISFIEPADTRVDQGPVVLTATAVSGLPVSFASTTSAVCTVSGASVTLVSTGTCTLTATQPGDASWAAATPVSQSFQITAAPVVPSAQSISFIEPADTRVDQGPVVLTATAVSGLPVSFASTTSAVCTVSGASVTLVSTGTCTLTATQAGDATYAAATPVSQSFQITAAPAAPPSPGAQSIVFTQPADAQVDQGPVVGLTANATSGLPVDFSTSTPSVCTVSGSSVTLVATGTCAIVAAQGGNASYSAAAPVPRSFLVTAAGVPPVVTTTTTTTTTAPAAPAPAPQPVTTPAPTVTTTAAPPTLPAPATKPAHTVAGTTTSALFSDLPTSATLTLGPAPAIPGITSVHVDGQKVVVTPSKTFSGVVTIPVVVSEGGQSVTTLATVVIRPAAPTRILSTPVSAGTTRIAWTPSPSAHGYVVMVDGRVMCRTTKNACVVSALLPVDAHVSVTSLGNAHTRSTEAPGRYAPAKPVLIAVVHFDTASFSLTKTAKAILNSTEAKIKRDGFTRAILHCHTDILGPFAYNLTLSQQRCLAVAAYVKKRIGIAHVQYRQEAFAYLQPIAPNSTASGKRKNRRVEIFVR